MVTRGEYTLGCCLRCCCLRCCCAFNHWVSLDNRTTHNDAAATVLLLLLLLPMHDLRLQHVVHGELLVPLSPLLVEKVQHLQATFSTSTSSSSSSSSSSSMIATCIPYGA